MIAAHTEAPHLRLWDERGGAAVPAGDQVGDARYPAIAPTGWVAFQFVASGTPMRWLAGTALLDASRRLVDLLPSALPTTAPAWSLDGSRLARVVTDHAGGTAVEVVDVASGRSVTVREAAGITAVTWVSRNRLLVAERACIVIVDPQGGHAVPHRRWPEAERFLRFGTDDYYPTLDHVAVAADQLLVEVRWHRAGRPAATTVYSWTGEHPYPLPAFEGCRYPVPLTDGRIIASAGDAVIAITPAGHRRSVRQLPTLREATMLCRE